MKAEGKGRSLSRLGTRNSSKKEFVVPPCTPCCGREGGWVDITQQERLPDHEEYAFKEVVYLLESD